MRTAGGDGALAGFAELSCKLSEFFGWWWCLLETNAMSYIANICYCCSLRLRLRLRLLRLLPAAACLLLPACLLQAAAAAAAVCRQRRRRRRHCCRSTTLF